jgi:Tol biopolymer transport system component
MKCGIVASIIAATLLFSAAPAEATFPGSNGKLVYYTSWVGPHTFFTPPDIYTVDPDGSNQARLTTDERSSYPTWSPDGQRIAFSSSRDRTDYGHSIYTMNADGSDVRRLTSHPPRNDYRPKWSPDGGKIAFISSRVEPEPDSCSSAPEGCNFEIYAVNADGSGETRLTNSAGIDRNPSWSPDGSRVVFESKRDGNYEIYAVNSDGTGTTRLTNDPRNDGDPEWSPLGDEIAFARATPVTPYTDRYHVNVMRFDGSGVRELPGPAGYTRNEPAWSPDGHWIAFVAFAGQDQIHVARSDGSGDLALTDDQAPVPDYPGFIANRAPTFSPDGTKVAFTHVECPYYCDYSQLQVVNADGSGGRTTVTANAAQEPDWQPLVGLQRSEYKNAAQFCKALREFLGDEAFRNRYGGGANAHGRCVSGDER